MDSVFKAFLYIFLKIIKWNQFFKIPLFMLYKTFFLEEVLINHNYAHTKKKIIRGILE